MKVWDFGEAEKSTGVGDVDEGNSCAFDQSIFSECRFEKLESDINVKLNLTDESLNVQSIST